MSSSADTFAVSAKVVLTAGIGDGAPSKGRKSDVWWSLSKAEQKAR